MLHPLFILIVLIWGSTWLAMKYQLGIVAEEVSLVYRFGIGTLLLFVYAWIKNTRLTLSVREHILAALMGLLLFSMNFLVFYWAAHDFASGLIAVVFSLASLMNLLFSALFYKTPIDKRIALGSILGTAGIAVVFWPELSRFDFSNQAIIALVYCIAGTAMFSLGNMVSIKTHAYELPVISANAYGMAYGTLILSLLAIMKGQSFNFDFSFSYVASLTYLAIIGTAVAFVTYLTLVAQIGAAKAAYSTIFFPVVALFLSTLFEDFQWTLLSVVGVAMALGSSALVISRKKAA